MNIEKTISEQAVSDILTPMLESQDRIVTEDVAPLFNKATGLDTPPASGTVTTTIEESRSVITAIIRKVWTATLTMLGGASVLSYIAAAYTYLLNRLQGNETYGTPDRRSEISASSPLAANLALLNDRKIGGIPEAADGISLVNLMSSAAYSEITELTDDNVGWELNRSITTSPFANLVKLKIGCKEAHLGSQYAVVVNVPTLQSLELPELEVVTGTTSSCGLVYGANQVSYLSAPKLKYAGGVFTLGLLHDCQLEELYLPEFIGFTYTYRTQLLTNCPTIKKINCPKFQQNVYGSILENCPNIEEIYVPSTENIASVSYERNMLKDLVHLRVFVAKALRQNGNPESFEGCTNLIHIEVCDGIAENIALNAWSPTNALDASRTDLIEEGSTAANNLEQFLQNFRDVLFTRLAQRTSPASLTLTLSPAVYKAVYGLDANYDVDPNAFAQTASLADLGITTEDLNEIEIAAGITTATKYATWLDTYRGAIYWNVQHS